MNAAQLLTSASSVVLTVLTKAGAALEDVQLVQAFVVNAVQLAEQTGKTGDEKLAAVLNATETYVNNALPTLKADWSSLAVQVRNFVNGVVSLWNALGVFVKDAESAAAGAIKTAETALAA
jgi:hypothetical protein